MTEPSCVLRADNLSKHFVQGGIEIPVLSGLSFELFAGEQVAVFGRSGSGKSTLMHILAGLDTPDEGSVWVAGVDIACANNDQRAAVRGEKMGFVYQNHHLLPEFTAQENVAMPLRIGGLNRTSAEEQSMHLLEEVGLGGRVTHLPHQLSGGERQRVAVARALAGDPQIILADEPTGNLDIDNATQVLELMHKMSADHGCAFVVVTHDTDTLPRFDRSVQLADGKLI